MGYVEKNIGCWPCLHFFLGLVQLKFPFIGTVLGQVRYVLYDYQVVLDWERLSDISWLQSPSTWLPVNSFLMPRPDEVTPAGGEVSRETLLLPVEGEITSRFGWREHPILGEQRFHYGIDIGAQEGTSIQAVKGGLVAGIGEHPELGLVVYLDHGGGLETIYAHCSQVLVELNQAVQAGEIIATVGASGLAENPHLHFEIKERGVNVDPALWLGEINP